MASGDSEVKTQGDDKKVPEGVKLSKAQVAEVERYICHIQCTLYVLFCMPFLFVK